MMHVIRIPFALVVVFVFCINPLTAHARDFMVGTLAYSLVAEGYPNVFVQGAITKRSAWFLDKCSDDGNTVAGLYKGYWRGFADGPYWFGGLIYVEKGSRAGTSLTAGLGYEHLLKSNISIGAYTGYAAGAEGQRFGVFDITLAYVFH